MNKKGSLLPPLKSLGQNFLQDKKIIDEIITHANLSKNDTVLEIGSGHGELTIPLAKTASRVIAIEIDRSLAANLKKFVPNNVRVIHADARRIDFTKLHLVAGKYIVVANLPFNIGTMLIRRLLETSVPPKRLVVILQNEVEKRILAKDKKESVLSLAVKYYGQARRLFLIPRSAYYPVPKVETSLLEIEYFLDESKRPPAGDFFRLIKAGFSARRKYLIKNLFRQLKIPLADLQEAFRAIRLSKQVRAEDLSFSKWLDLTIYLFRGCGKDRS